MTLSSPVSCATHAEAGNAAGGPKRRDRADYEVTQMVPTADGRCPRPSLAPRMRRVP